MGLSEKSEMPVIQETEVLPGSTVSAIESVSEGAMAIRRFPATPYRAFMAGEMTAQEFVDQLVAHVKRDRGGEARGAHVKRRSIN